MTFRPAQFPNNPSSRIQRDERGRWVLPPPGAPSGPSLQARRGAALPHDPAFMFFDASSVVAEDQEVAPTVITSANSWERSSSVWQLVAHLHHDAERAAQFQALARAASAKRLEWVRRVPDLSITDVVELPEPERRHLAIGLQVPDGPLMSLEVAVLPDDRALDQARLWNGPPDRVLKGTCCPEHAATVRAMPLNMAARFLERGVNTPLLPKPFDPSDVTEGLWPLIWFVMQRLRQQR